MSPRPSGMKAFILIWVGQVFSMVGTQMTNFAMGIWAWEQTGEATALAMVNFFAFTPLIIFSPIAGVLVDRWNRKLVMALSDIGEGIVTITMLVLLLICNLKIWHLYITGAISGIFGAFQWPAYSAAITLMVPKKHYARTSGMISMAGSGVGIIAPILAGFLIAIIGTSGIIAIDLGTLIIALAFLLLVIVPEPEKKPTSRVKHAFFNELVYGFRYIIDRKPLLYLQLVFFLGNLFFTIAYTLLNPMILASTGGASTILGSVQSAGAIGGLVLMGLGRSLPFWLISHFLMMLVMPMLNGANQAIWQLKTAPDVQGRVFSVRRLVAQITAPISMAIAGPLADDIFEPALSSSEHWLSRVLSPVFSVGAGAGMSLIILSSGTLVAGVGLGAYQIRQTLDVEKLIPDHDEGK